MKALAAHLHPNCPQVPLRAWYTGGDAESWESVPLICQICANSPQNILSWFRIGEWRETTEFLNQRLGITRFWVHSLCHGWLTGTVSPPSKCPQSDFNIMSLFSPHWKYFIGLQGSQAGTKGLYIKHTAGYLAWMKTCPCFTHCFSRNFSKCRNAYTLHYAQDTTYARNRLFRKRRFPRTKTKTKTLALQNENHLNVFSFVSADASPEKLEDSLQINVAVVEFVSEKRPVNKPTVLTHKKRKFIRPKWVVSKT